MNNISVSFRIIGEDVPICYVLEMPPAGNVPEYLARVPIPDIMTAFFEPAPELFNFFSSHIITTERKHRTG